MFCLHVTCWLAFHMYACMSPCLVAPLMFAFVLLACASPVCFCISCLCLTCLAPAPHIFPSLFLACPCHTCLCVTCLFEPHMFSHVCLSISCLCPPCLPVSLFLGPTMFVCTSLACVLLTCLLQCHLLACISHVCLHGICFPASLMSACVFLPVHHLFVLVSLACACHSWHSSFPAVYLNPLPTLKLHLYALPYPPSQDPPCSFLQAPHVSLLALVALIFLFSTPRVAAVPLLCLCSILSGVWSQTARTHPQTALLSCPNWSVGWIQESQDVTHFVMGPHCS